MPKVGVFGGTFNPPHKGHLELARRALEVFSLDKIIWIPTGNSYMKTGVTDKFVRLAMTSIFVRDEAGMEVSDMEVNREGATYTYETLSILKEESPDNELYLILGGDSLQKIGCWKNPEIIFKNASIICAYRAEDNTKEEYLEALKQVANELKMHYNAKIHFMDFDVNISSTKVRDYIKTGKDAHSFLSEDLLEYIKGHQLYIES